MAESELSTSQRYAVDHDEEAEDSAEDSDAEEGSAAARGGKRILCNVVNINHIVRNLL